MDTRRIRRLKAASTLEVVAVDGQPVRVLLAKRWQEVTLARSPWRVEQHWWRETPVQRDYFRLIPAGGPSLTVYHDLLSDTWARQEY